MRKTRSDAVLLNLPEEQQARLAEWLLNGMPYHEAKVLTEKEFGISVRSLASFGSFWSQVCQPLLLARRRRAVGAADSRVEEAERNPAQFDRATIDAIKQKAFELAESPQSDPKDVKAILTLVLKARDQDIEERRVAILEARAKQAEQAETVLQENVSPEEQAARIREIFKR
jgi:hypothetical protein